MINSNIIKKILEIKKKLNENVLLEDSNWDSLTMINLISYLSKYKKIKSNDLLKLKTIKDLDIFISKIKK